MTGVVFQQSGGHVAPRIRTHDGRRSLDVALAFASPVFRLDHVATVRACRCVVAMPAFTQFNTGEVLAWRRGVDADSVIHYTLQGKDVSRTPLAQALSQEFEEVDTHWVAWSEVCFVQCVCARRSGTRYHHSRATDAVIRKRRCRTSSKHSSGRAPCRR